jgi:hypothetical protein
MTSHKFLQGLVLFDVGIRIELIEIYAGHSVPINFGDRLIHKKKYLVTYFLKKSENSM